MATCHADCRETWRGRFRPHILKCERLNIGTIVFIAAWQSEAKGCPQDAQQAGILQVAARGGVRLQLCRTWAQKLRFHRRQIANGRHVSDGRISYANCQFSALAAGRRPGILNKQDFRFNTVVTNSFLNMSSMQA